MKKVLPLAMVAALATAPAWAAGMGQQSGSAQQGMQDQQQQSQQSPSLQGQQQGMQGQDGLQQSAGQQQQQGQREMIREVQQNLQQQGYDVGNLDGVWGPNTQQALRQFQQEQGLQATGRLNQNTLAELNVDANPNQLAEMPDDALDADLGAQMGGTDLQSTGDLEIQEDMRESPAGEQLDQQTNPGITD